MNNYHITENDIIFEYYLIALNKVNFWFSKKIAKCYNDIIKFMDCLTFYQTANEQDEICDDKKIDNFNKEIVNLEKYKDFVELTKNHRKMKNFNTNYELANRYTKNKEYKFALKTYLKLMHCDHESIVNADKLSELNYNIGYCYEKLNNKKDAIKYFSSSDDQKAIKYLAKYYYGENRFKKAIEYFEKIIDIDDESLFKLARSYYRKSNYNRAISIYQELIKRENVKSNRYNNLAECYSKIKNYNHAEKYFLTAINKGNNISLYNIAKMYNNVKQYDKAKKYLFMAIKKKFYCEKNESAIFKLYIQLHKQEDICDLEYIYSKELYCFGSKKKYDTRRNTVVNAILKIYEKTKKINNQKVYCDIMRAKLKDKISSYKIMQFNQEYDDIMTTFTDLIKENKPSFSDKYYDTLVVFF
ncbi:TPR repeat protein [Catovirus CTV1]|uniref:TPR repeat protein n=1 Tax=Catovirus CTV1 TaxID=1977631 RepID=A0A1V0S948_9VIRU|nr:TPR repeat protein [Catovirus CTV1]